MPEPNFIIRNAAAEDLETIFDLAQGAPEAPHWGEQVYRQIVMSSGEAAVKRILFVLMEDATLLGFTVASCVNDLAEIESIVVRVEMRRRGLGKELCSAVMHWAVGEGATYLVLEVRSKNPNARRLYAAMGFSEVGVRPGYYREPVDDAVMMRTPLPQTRLQVHL